MSIKFKMRLAIVTGLILVMIYCVNNCQCIFHGTEVVYAGERPTLTRMVTRRLNNIWSWIQAQPQDSFVGRCGGIFKKLRMLMTFIVFKLGVILTTLAFLSIFALKSLGLLVLLVVINSAGILAKLTTFKHNDGGGRHPQNIHIYVPKTDDHDYVEYPHHHSKWIDRGDFEEKYYKNNQELEDINHRLSMYREMYKNVNTNQYHSNQYSYR